MPLDVIASSGFGSLLGMRHALEPDHLAAVSTLVSRERSGCGRRGWALLGAGHTLRCWSGRRRARRPARRDAGAASDAFELRWR